MYKTQTHEFSFRLKPSAIQGVGVFATHGIAAGTMLALKPLDYRSRRLRKEEVPAEFQGYCVEDQDDRSLLRCPNEFNRMWLCWFLNHADQPNAQGDDSDNFTYHALRDINEGEEITINYSTLD